jgi:hypothetical protein
LHTHYLIVLLHSEAHLAVDGLVDEPLVADDVALEFAVEEGLLLLVVLVGFLHAFDAIVTHDVDSLARVEAVGEPAVVGLGGEGGTLKQVKT